LTIGAPGNLTYIDVSVRIDCQTMRCYKLTGFLSGTYISQFGQTLTCEIMDANAAPKVRVVSVHGELGGQLTDVNMFAFDV